MAYNSAYTGAQIDGAVSTVRSNAEGWSNKQNAITASGVLKGDGAGNVTAAEAGVDYVAAAHLTDESAHSALFAGKLTAPTPTASDNGKFLRVQNGAAVWETVSSAEEASF